MRHDAPGAPPVTPLEDRDVLVGVGGDGHPVDPRRRDVAGEGVAFEEGEGSLGPDRRGHLDVSSEVHAEQDPLEPGC
jgi:hypothetical protein